MIPSSYYSTASSLFAHPQPPLGFIWTPCTRSGAEASQVVAARAARTEARRVREQLGIRSTAAAAKKKKKTRTAKKEDGENATVDDTSTSTSTSSEEEDEVADEEEEEEEEEEEDAESQFYSQNSEVERSYLMGSCGKHILPRVRLTLRAATTTNSNSGGASSLTSVAAGAATSYEPPLALIASPAYDDNAMISAITTAISSSSSSSSSSSFISASAAPAQQLHQLQQFAAVPGDVLWEESPAIVFSDTVHLRTLLGGGGSGEGRGAGDKQLLAAGKDNASSSSSLLAQRVAAVWSMMSQKATTTATTPPASSNPSSSVATAAFGLQYGRGFSAVATGLIALEKEREAMEEKVKRLLASASPSLCQQQSSSSSSVSPSPIVDSSSSLQDALTTLGFFQSVACWQKVRAAESAKGEAGVEGGEEKEGDLNHLCGVPLTHYIAPPAIAASAATYTQQRQQQSNANSLIADTYCPPLLTLDKYYYGKGAKEKATVPTALMTMVQKVSSATATANSNHGGGAAAIEGKGSNISRSSDDDRSHLERVLIDPLCLHKKKITATATSTTDGSSSGKGEEVGGGDNQHIANNNNSDDANSQTHANQYAAAMMPCLWKLCQERSLLLLKDPDGCCEGEGDGGESNHNPNSASSIMKNLLLQQQQQQGGDSSSASSSEAISIFCPIAATANFTKFASVANAQLVIVQQAMPIFKSKNKDGSRKKKRGEKNRESSSSQQNDKKSEINFRYRFVVQAIATRPIRRGEEIRLPMNLLSVNQYSQTFPTTAASEHNNSSKPPRPSIGIASAVHLEHALKTILDAISKNPTAAKRMALLLEAVGGGGSGSTHKTVGDAMVVAASGAEIASSGGDGSGSGAVSALGRIEPFIIDSDYRRHLGRVRESYEALIRQHFASYLGQAALSRQRANNIMSMMQRQALKRTGATTAVDGGL